ncbi:hypothetical protein IMZ11_02385 [Microtetraspora sp. AC03309]|uniref:hypothetical protein n=1 Tax=Microtetraspora sp. AC03309 TaxID=2779376 RepID=UPI001E500908|nr:hypothetical protein [Microtetraspora sp. AC03309]MCC5574488.1 hypothetical protein [Microtetraspora sp. AC03309]
MPKNAGKSGHIRGITPGREDVYRELKPRYGKTKAAKIANAGKTNEQRSRMAKKAARTRKARSG